MGIGNKTTKRARKAIESQYNGSCDILEYQPTRNEKTKVNERAEVMVFQNQLCKVSFEKITNVNSSDTTNKVSQVIKLFIAPELNIDPGSKIIATQENRTEEYQSSGKPAIYVTHQEIILELFKGWA